ncbi:MAG: 50S ribosomal protein L3 N(5)-glutamine methyltransferase [Proteobacteria bacterium]|nr:50S ribosomal protein L3 N(5)-glutamine methyltransferase [Pseudomonadota bacterium]
MPRNASHRHPRYATGRIIGAHARERASPATVGEAIEACARELTRARVHFGHGTDNARDEAAELVFFVAHLDHARGAGAYALPLNGRQRARIAVLLARRIRERAPLAYLTHRAFFAGLQLYVDDRVLVPRSPIAELILARFRPWIDPRRVRRIADIGTGSGAIALACARAFARARVDALDISGPALSVCRRNIRRLALGARVRALRSDHLDAVRGTRYDILVSNPPYVGRAEMRRLPPEYRHEPASGLAAGRDGLDSVRIILRQARAHLRDRGILVVEVGNTERTLQRAFPRLPFLWPMFEHGGGGVFVLRAQDLDEADVSVSAVARRAKRGRQ